MGRLERLELENFKSYGGRVLVGPFKNFTSVIGPNGAGKSNLMDAISFVLGVRTFHLRGRELKDLIYRGKDNKIDEVNKLKASVRLVYKMDDAEVEQQNIALEDLSDDETNPGTKSSSRSSKRQRRPAALDQSTSSSAELVFMRSINPSGSADYKINGKSVSWEIYNKRLADIGILVKARNFLVFQNEVESIASKNPKELCLLFEEISGSMDFKDEYEALKQERAIAEENVLFAHQKKKGISAEKRQIKAQKEEAMKCIKLQEKLELVRRDLVLYKLFHLQKEYEKAQSSHTQLQLNLRNIEQELSRAESSSTQLRKMVSDINKKKATQDKEMEKILKDMKNKESSCADFETERMKISKRIDKDTKTLASKTNEFEEQQKKITVFKNAIGDVQEAISNAQAELTEAEKLLLPDSEIQEYKILKSKAINETSIMNDNLESAQRRKRVAEERKKSYEAQVQEAQSRIDNAKKELHVFETRVEGIRDRIAKAMEASQKAVSEKDTFIASSNQRTLRRSELEFIVKETSVLLREAKVDFSNDAREKKFNDALQNMIRLFPGVRGRLSDLCQPVQDKYKEAVAVIFGKLMDAIVVDTTKTGSDCMQYLKEQRTCTATFLPLNDLRSNPINESFRRLGGTAKLCIDILKFDSNIEAAVRYATSNSVVCDTLDEARDIRYRRKHKLKICALDGTLIDKAGLMTGGISSGQDRAKKWDRGMIENLKSRNESALRDLEQLGSDSRDRAKEGELNNNILEANSEVQRWRLELKISEERIERIKKLLFSAESDCVLLQSDSESVLKEWQDCTNTINSLVAKLEAVESNIFGNFLSKHKIESLTLFEDMYIKRGDSLRDKILRLENNKNKLESQLKYEESRDLQETLQQLKDRLSNDNEKLGTLVKKVKTLRKEQDQLSSKHRDILEKHSKLSETQSKAETDLKDSKSKEKKLQEKISEIAKLILSVEAEMEELNTKRFDLVKKSRMDQIDIPRLDDAELDEEQLNSGVDYIDFSTVARKHREASVKDQATIEKEFENSEKYVLAQIESLKPNLKANERFDVVKAQLDEISKEWDSAREKLSAINEKFEDIRRKRHEKFMSCFDHVSNKISDVYKDLTRSAAYPMGGTAYLSLESQEDPYLGGIKFNIMPPTKRIRDIEQMSGGERTLAALALLFAIHDFRPSPFFVLDEIDAALDKLNVSRVSAYVRSRSSDMQTIVISLKDSFYEKADALVGIHRDQQEDASRVLTLDLNQFSEQAATAI